mmetsp:Transcript_38039/g.88982  ORF Transcript_38039/g.88982 Transcript_38039/m.88982 type:complete len:211 (-) Transcript_38039:188-820(-)
MPAPALEPRLLKVPRWLSEAWKSSPPEGVVADIDLAGGKLHLRVAQTDGHERPVTLDLQSRDSPEIFAFTKEAHGSQPQATKVVQALHVKANLNDQAYRGMLQRRAEEATIASGNRTAHTPQAEEGFDTTTILNQMKKDAQDQFRGLREEETKSSATTAYTPVSVKKMQKSWVATLPTQARENLEATVGQPKTLRQMANRVKKHTLKPGA